MALLATDMSEKEYVKLYVRHMIMALSVALLASFSGVSYCLLSQSKHIPLVCYEYYTYLMSSIAQ